MMLKMGGSTSVQFGADNPGNRMHINYCRPDPRAGNEICSNVGWERFNLMLNCVSLFCRRTCVRTASALQSE